MKVGEETSGKSESQFVMRKPNKIIYYISNKSEFMFHVSRTEGRQIMIWNKKYARCKRLGKQH
jgi:hypothetical protein